MKTEEKLYFAYGSNMNLNQMEFRCPDAEAVDTVRLEGYRLTFRMNGGRRGVAAVLPEEGSHVDGVLWKISGQDGNFCSRAARPALTSQLRNVKPVQFPSLSGK